MMSNWTHDRNMLNKDFELYSEYEAAKSRTASARWQFCNYDDPSGVGAFRDCGAAHAVPNQWNSFSGRGGQASVRFSIDASGAHPPPPPPPPPAPAPIGLSVLGSADGHERTEIGLDLERRLVLVNATEQGGGVTSAPLLAHNSSADVGEALVHAIVDHSILEVIVNNRTAFTIKLSPSASDCDEVQLLGLGQPRPGVEATLDVWRLESANNL